MQQMQKIGPHRFSGSLRKVSVRKAMRPDFSVLMGADTVVNAEGRLFRDHAQLNGLQDFSVNLDVDLVFTDLPQRTLGQFNLGIGHFKDRKSTRLNSSHVAISYAVFCLKKK